MRAQVLCPHRFGAYLISTETAAAGDILTVSTQIMWLCVHVCMCMLCWVYVAMYGCVCTYIRYVYTYVRTYVCVCVCGCVYVCVITYFYCLSIKRSSLLPSPSISQVFFAVVVGAMYLGQTSPYLQGLATAASANGPLLDTIDRVGAP